MLNFEQLRHRATPGFPYLMLYREQTDRIEIIRLLHARRDIPSLIG
ncbi:hypothetical protein [Leucobacter tenebrionis]